MTKIIDEEGRELTDWPALGGMRVQVSEWMPANRAVMVGSTCRHCGQSMGMSWCMKDPAGYGIHSPQMVILELEDSNGDKEKTS